MRAAGLDDRKRETAREPSRHRISRRVTLSQEHRRRIDSPFADCRRRAWIGKAAERAAGHSAAGARQARVGDTGPLMVARAA